MLLPYSTDAPIYHFPFATIGLIIANLAAFGMSVVVSEADPHSLDAYLLQYNTIAPWQWLTTNFLHAGVGHLLGNMIFLWSFSLIVEGKIGWWKYLLLYLTIGILYGAIVQLSMFCFSDGMGAALGASGAIFGILAVAVCWAPKNELSCMVFIYFRPRIFEISILMFGFLYLVFQLLPLGLTGFRMSSQMLHLVGLLVGLPIGLLMVKFGFVDCEGWDLINVLNDTTGREKVSAQQLVEKSKARTSVEDQKQREVTVRSLQAAIDAENWNVAAALLSKQSLFSPQHPPPERLLMTIVRGLHQHKQWQKSIPVMTTILECSSSDQVAIRLKLAQIYLQIKKRPARALRLIESVPDDIPSKQAQLRQRIERAARKQLSAGDNELELSED